MTALLYSLAALCLVLSIASYLAVRLRERRIAAARDEAPIKPVTFSPNPGEGPACGYERTEAKLRALVANREAEQHRDCPTPGCRLAEGHAGLHRFVPEVARLRAELAAAQERVAELSAIPRMPTHGKHYDAEAGTCSYCHGVGACPECWGRVGIDRLEARAEAAERALKVLLPAAKAAWVRRDLESITELGVAMFHPDVRSLIPSEEVLK